MGRMEGEGWRMERGRALATTDKSGIEEIVRKVLAHRIATAHVCTRSSIVAPTASTT